MKEGVILPCTSNVSFDQCDVYIACVWRKRGRLRYITTPLNSLYSQFVVVLHETTSDL
jgi:hypothetical protein